MNIVDSCGWLEYFGNGPNAPFFAEPLEATAELVVPSVSIYEVFKRVMLQRGEGPALQAVAMMEQGKVVDLTSSGALAAARLSLAHGIPMADSMMFAVAQAHDATLWTQDADFADIPEVRYMPRNGGGRPG